MRKSVKGLSKVGEGYLEVSERLIDTYREEQRKERENPREYNVPMAEFILAKIREKKGKGYNYQLGYQCILNGNYWLLNQKLHVSEVHELFIRESDEEDIEKESSAYEGYIDKWPLPYLVETSEERIMRN